MDFLVNLIVLLYPIFWSLLFRMQHEFMIELGTSRFLARRLRLLNYDMKVGFLLIHSPPFHLLPPDKQRSLPLLPGKHSQY